MGHGKSQNALKMGRFGTKNGSKMGEKRVFPKVILDHSGCSNKWFGPILSPWCRVLAHGKSQNALKRGWFNTKNGSKLGEKRKNTSNNNKQQALLLSVLAIAPPHRSGLYSTLATLEPRWCPCQIQVLSKKLTGGAPGRWRQVRRCPPKSVQLWAKNSHFSPKIAPKPGRKAQTKGNGGYIARAA